MRGEKRPYAHTVLIMNKFNNCFCYAITIVSACAPSYLIKEYQAFGCCIVEDICKFHHLYHESALTACKVVKCPNSCEYPVNPADGSKRRRNKTANLCHENNQRRLSHISGFSGHVWPGQEQELVILAIHMSIIRDKSTRNSIFYYRMPSVPYQNIAAFVYFRSYVFVIHSHFGKVYDNIEFTESLRRHL